MTSIATVITLVVTFLAAGQEHPLMLQEVMPSVDECWDVAREFTAQAEDIQIRLGGTLTASCTVTVKKSEDH